MTDANHWFPDTQFEERLVAFVDVLGWKAKVDEAVVDPTRVGVLASVLNIFSVFAQEGLVPRTADARLSTFSDNLVVSLRYDPALLHDVIGGLAKAQAGVAVMGFFLRGGVTVGQLSHTQHHVFGPALNRAYYLESKRAVQPRILLDTQVPDLVALSGPLICVEDQVQFLDPFRADFVDSALANQRDVSAPLQAYSDSLGIIPPNLNAVQITGRDALLAILEHLSLELGKPLLLKEWSKLAWLFDRIASRLNVEIRSSGLPREIIERRPEEP